MKSKASDDICTACSLSSSLPLQIWCIDCGEIVETGKFDAKTCRCKECQSKIDKELNKIASRERMRRYRSKL